MKLGLVLEDDAVDAELARVWAWRSEVVWVAVKHTHARSESLVRNWLPKAGHEAGSLTIHLGEELTNAFMLQLRYCW